MHNRLRTVFPIISWLPRYEAQWLRFDFIAGITLAAYAVPVSLAYASLAGLPSQAGLYCYLLGGIAYAIFGTSRRLAIGANIRHYALRQSHLAMGVAVLTGFLAVLAWGPSFRQHC